MSKVIDKKCSFCGRAKNQVSNIFAGPGVFICNHCVDSCNHIIKSQQKKAINNSTFNHTPKQLYEFLDSYIIGQHQAKKVLAVAVYNHYKRLKNNKSTDVEIDKSNILLLGPTGSGKTLLAKTIAKILDVPFTIADATTITEAGYVGDDVENVIKNLLIKSDYDIKKAESGIIFLDEIDKISRKSDSMSITRDVSGEGVQQAMLKLIEGTTAQISPQGRRKHPEQPTISVDTSKILFICGGAFDGLAEIIKQRVISNKINIGFGATIKNNNNISTNKLLAQVEPTDLIKFGLIPELVGRLPVYVNLDELNEDDLIAILTKPKNSLTKQFSELFLMEGVKLTIQKSALYVIVKDAIAKKTGARGLRSVLENILLDISYKLPSLKGVKEVIVTKKSVSDPTKIIVK